ncbi:MAG: DUF554 domain-containing protein [Oscillatoriales cyanobacterium C42_A2020_001]|nr:DUF554 domain-containing protein [Leptolyngbyaceae cyanobacterium C42_A2020_001]
MGIDFWVKTSGTWVNVVAVLLGTTVGMLLRGRLPARMMLVITQGVGLLTLFLGFTMAANLTKAQAGIVDGIVLGLVTLVVGGLLGEWWRIEDGLAQIGDRLKKQFSGGSGFTEGFVAASLLFCVGPMTLLGCLSNGLTGDNRLLLLKSTMDGLVAIAFTSSFGIGVGFSVLPILFYQGGLSLLAGLLAQIIPNPATSPPILLATGVGGLMIVGIGINLLDLTKIRVAAFLPALLLAPLFYWLGSLTS